MLNVNQPDKKSMSVWSMLCVRRPKAVSSITTHGLNDSETTQDIVTINYRHTTSWINGTKVYHLFLKLQNTTLCRHQFVHKQNSHPYPDIFFCHHPSNSQFNIKKYEFLAFTFSFFVDNNSDCWSQNLMAILPLNALTIAFNVPFWTTERSENFLGWA